MLELAYMNKIALNEKWLSAVDNISFFYYFVSPVTYYKLDIAENDAEVLQYVRTLLQRNE